MSWSRNRLQRSKCRDENVATNMWIKVLMPKKVPSKLDTLTFLCPSANKLHTFLTRLQQAVFKIFSITLYNGALSSADKRDGKSRSSGM